MENNNETWDKSAAETVRSLIRDENTWINNRLTWLSAFEGLLFTGLGFVWDKPANYWLIIIFCSVGALFALLSLIGVDGAGRAIRKQTTGWHNHKPKDYNGPDVIGLPSPSVPWLLEGVGPWTGFPVIIFAAWIAIGVVFITGYGKAALLTAKAQPITARAKLIHRQTKPVHGQIHTIEKRL